MMPAASHCAAPPTPARPPPRELIAEGDSVVFEVNGERMSIITAHKST